MTAEWLCMLKKDNANPVQIPAMNVKTTLYVQHALMENTYLMDNVQMHVIPMNTLMTQIVNVLLVTLLAGNAKA